MSILIKGMEMPKSCAKCKLFGEYGCAFIGAVGYALTEGRRSENCPLVPLPDHGDLIEEADAIETAWMILRGLGYFKEENPQLEQTVREVFATAPAIEVE